MVLTKAEILSLLSSSPPLIEEFIDSTSQVQPNGFDLTVRSVTSIRGTGRIDFSNEQRTLPDLIPRDFDTNGWLKLSAGSYIVAYNEIVNLPNNLMAIGKPRSSLLRMGATIESAIWDSGYHGRGQSLLIVSDDGLEIAQNARLLQLVFFRLSHDTEPYSGLYQREGI